jgi:hypothetical protein
MRPIFDIEDGDFLVKTSDNMAYDSEGNMMMKIGRNMAMDMDSGDIHFVSGWSSFDSDDEDEF